MIIKKYGFKKALSVLVIVTVLVLTGCGASEDDTSFELHTPTEYPDENAHYEVEEKTEKDTSVYVYVCGRVKKPGVYAVSENTRMYEVINLAGGVQEDADISLLNQAQKVSDGQQVYVPSVQEVQEAGGSAAQTGNSAIITASADDGLVNINTADPAELQTLTGIGASRAQAIIDYRNENGSFERIEDIMNVTGIKEGMFSKIKDRIKVR